MAEVKQWSGPSPFYFSILAVSDTLTRSYGWGGIELFLGGDLVDPIGFENAFSFYAAGQ